MGGHTGIRLVLVLLFAVLLLALTPGDSQAGSIIETPIPWWTGWEPAEERVGDTLTFALHPEGYRYGVVDEYHFGLRVRYDFTGLDIVSAGLRVRGIDAAEGPHAVYRRNILYMLNRVDGGGLPPDSPGVVYYKSIGSPSWLTDAQARTLYPLLFGKPYPLLDKTYFHLAPTPVSMSDRGLFVAYAREDVLEGDALEGVGSLLGTWRDENGSTWGGETIYFDFAEAGCFDAFLSLAAVGDMTVFFDPDVNLSYENMDLVIGLRAASDPTPVPEPASLALVLLAGGTLGLVRRDRARKVES